jgi:hypothetical protein
MLRVTEAVPSESPSGRRIAKLPKLLRSPRAVDDPALRCTVDKSASRSVNRVDLSIALIMVHLLDIVDRFVSDPSVRFFENDLRVTISPVAHLLILPCHFRRCFPFESRDLFPRTKSLLKDQESPTD